MVGGIGTQDLDIRIHYEAIHKNILVTVCNHPLGWGRLSQTTVKNKYLPGWRWM